MSVRKSLAWAFFAKFASFILLFAGSVAVARLLSPREMGIYAIATATAGLISIVSAFAVSAYVVREADLTDAKLATACTMNMLLSIMLATFIFGGSFLSAWFFEDAGVGRALRLLALMPLIAIIEFRPGVMMQRMMQIKPAALIGTAATVLNVSLTVFFAASGYSYMSMVYAGLVTSISGAIATAYVGRRYLNFKISFEAWRTILYFGLRMMSISGIAVFAQRLSEIALGKLLGLPALGLYSRASNISNLIFTNVYGTATNIAFIKLSEDYRETGSVRSTFLTSFEMITAVMWPLLIGLAVLAGPFVNLLYGHQWLAAAPVLSVLMIAQAVTLCFGMNWELFVLRDETAKQTKFEAIRAVVGVCLLCFGALFNILAAAFGRVAEAIFGMILYLPHMGRLAEARRSELVPIYLRGLAATLAAVMPATALMVAKRWSPNVDLLAVAGAVGLGLVLWCLVLRKMNHLLLGEFDLLLVRFGLRAATPQRPHRT
jgi:O-antigen/teichoic acid export membrane protein